MITTNYLRKNVIPGAASEMYSLADLIKEDCSKGRRGLLCGDANEVTIPSHAGQQVVEKELVIFFLDIRNYTVFLQSGSELENVQTVKKLLDLFVKIIFKFSGVVLERAGDGLYAVFGLETQALKAADNALDSSHMILEALELINQQYAKAKFGFPLQVGIGLNAGKVIVEYAHSFEMPLSVMGLPVNVAARLQEQTKYQNNELILSDAFYNRLSDDYQYRGNRERRQLKLAGFHDPQTVWLAGKPYNNQLCMPTRDMDFYMALAG